MKKQIKNAGVGLCSIILALGFFQSASADLIQVTQHIQSTIVNDAHYDIIIYADQFIGNPYKWAGNSLTQGCDCSHFVWLILKNTGHYIGKYAVSDDWIGLGQNVSSIDNAVAGDVIIYPGHVAIYDGQGFIVEARGSAWGITHDRQYNYNTILAIRHFN